MNILITGASGSMAHYLIDHIKRIELGAHIAGVGRRFINWDNPAICKLDRYEPCNLSEPWGLSFLSQVIVNDNPNIIFHLASMAEVGPSFNHPLEYLGNNINCTANLYEAMRETKFGGVCVLASTSEVYGDVPTNCPIFEHEPFRPISPYGISKCAQEHLARFYFKTYGIKTVITRAFGYINPLRPDLVATAIARQIIEAEMNGGGTIRHGNTAPVRTFCDVRDVAEAYWLAATMCEPGEAYNVGSEVGVSIGDLLQLLANAAQNGSGKDTRLEFVRDDTLMRPTDVSRCVPDCTKFRRATGWQPRIPLRESLEWLIECARSGKDG